jgi:2-amino-4-hydroxy-6-hydroxymethyldihydropteridine diphosphokinase
VLAQAMYVVGLGSNLGARYATIAQAVERLGASADCRVLARSRVYESEPLGPPQPLFLNAAVLVDSALSPEALLGAALDIERALGRVREARWGPRTIDLDLLWGPRPVASARLTLPHPGLSERWFALAPLLDVVRGAPAGLIADDAAPAQLAALAAIAGEQLSALGGVPEGVRITQFGEESARAHT